MSQATIEGFRLSPQQSWLWSSQQAGPRHLSSAQSAVVIEGGVDAGTLELALRDLVRRHEILRTTFHSLPGVDFPLQVVNECYDLSFQQHDLRDLSPAEQGVSVEALFSEEQQRPFDLERASLLRASLVTLSPTKHVLLISLPALCSDGAGILALAREISTSYEALLRGETPGTPLQYADISEIFNDLLESDESAAHREFWRGKDSEDAPAARLPFEKQPPADERFEPQTITRTIDPDLAKEIDARAEELGVTSSIFLQACWHILLWRFTQQQEVTVSAAFEGRTYEGLDELPGLFVRYLPVTSRIEAGLSVSEVVTELGRASASAHEWQEYATADSAAHTAPFAFDSRALPPSWLAASLTWSPSRLAAPSPHATLLLRLLRPPHAGALDCRLHFDASRLSAQEARRLLAAFARLTGAAARRPLAPVASLDVVGRSERRHLLRRLNRTRRDFGHGPSRLEELVSSQAARHPARVAVVSEGRRLSYAELEERAERLALRLRRRGVRAGDLVGVMVERSEWLVVAMLGVLKAGAGYVPVEAGQPAERLRAVLGGAGVRCVVTRRGLWEGAELSGEAVYVDEVSPEEETAGGDGAAAEASVGRGAEGGEGVAYVIHTSGSTGTPKGVMIPHRAIINFLLWSQETLPLSEGDRVLQKTSLGFDASVWELFAPLIAGATLVMAKPGGHQDTAYLLKLIEEEQITHLKVVPSMLRMLLAEDGLEESGRSLRRIFCGGEALSFDLAEAVGERLAADLYNMYGPTEATIDATAQKYERGQRRTGQTVPIGRPLANTQVYVLDSLMQVVPLGVVGELYIGGDGLARGYLNQPDMTAEKFVPDPFSREAGGRLYRTGDLVRQLRDGSIEYLGRIDHQVKVRGYRIELGEIETALAKHPAVRECVVVAREYEEGEKRLVAYVVGGEAEELTVESLRGHLKERLPEYMVPSAFVRLPELPLLSNGKLDRKRLPAPEQTRPDTGVSYVAPRTGVEAALVEVWREVLGVDRVGVMDNFFALGGDSIRSVRVLALAKEKGLNFTLQQLFKHNTVSELAREIGQGEQAAEPVVHTEPFGLISAEDRQKLPREVEDAYPLTMLQSGMLYHMEMWPESPAYHNINTWHLRAPFNIEHMREAMQYVINRHPALRTGFDLTGYSEPLQLVYDRVTVPVGYDDLRHLPADEQERVVEAFLQQEKTNLFDVKQPPLIRYHIHRFGEDTFQLTLTECHPISDGYSTTTTLFETFKRYSALLKNERPADDEPLKSSFRDFVLLEREALNSEESREFWARKLSGCTPMALPQRAAEAGGGRVRKTILPLSAEIVGGLNRLAQSCSVPLKSVLLAAHLKVMNLISGQKDVLTGLLFNGRPEVLDGEQVRGLFLNTLPFRLGLNGGTWAELIKQAFEAEQEILPHRRYPMAALQKQWGRQPLFETMFTYLNFHSLESLLSSGEVQPIERGTRNLSENNFALYAVFYAMPDGSELKLIVDFDVSRFSPEQMQTIQGYYEAVLKAMIEDAHRGYRTQDLIPAAERERLLVRWNDTAASYTPLCIHELFEAQAASTPHRVAVTCEGEQITYGELEKRANRLANYLRGRGVGRESLVGVMLERSVDVVVALLGVLKAGAAYVPLDPTHPRDRLELMAEDARLTALLTQEWLVGVFPEGVQTQVICLDGEREAVAAASGEKPESHTEAEGLAYVIYTSGSTGRPKGVQITHRAVANFLDSMRRRPGLTADDRLLSVTTLSFDIAGLEIFLPLTVGARVELVVTEVASEGAQLMEKLASSGATVMQATPATWRLLQSAGWQGDGRLKALCGGETLSRSLADYLLACCGSVWNMYGPTESTVWSVISEVEPGTSLVPIGRPIANTQVFILDAQSELLPAGVVGELCIGGDGLARGYLNQPNVTAEKFVPHPFSTEAGALLYRTGDLARYLPDGSIECLGRIDHQVKVRGHRIELGEIESALAQHPSVAQSVVVLREDAPDDKRLVAYVTARQSSLKAGELRRHLKEKLPEYMMPSAYVLLDELPLTPNGKIDRRALPAPGHERLSEDRPYVAPRNLTEELMAGIWAELFGGRPVGAFDNFFELGGHSLLATQLVSRVRNAFKTEITLHSLFQHPTVAGLSRQVEEAMRGGQSLQALPLGSAARGETAPLSFTQEREWHLDQLKPDDTHNHVPSAVRLSGVLDVTALERSLNEIVRRHEILRTTFPAVNGQPVQVVAPFAPFALPVIDLGEPTGAQDERVEQLLLDFSRQRFDLGRGPLLRVRLVRLREQEHVLFIAAHHLICDGWSVGVLIRELTALYEAYATGQPPQLAELPVQYADYALWQRRWLQGEVLERQLDYWKKQLGGRLTPLELPTDRPRPSASNYRGATHTFSLTPALVESLKALCPREDGTQFMKLLAAFNILLHVYTGQGDIVVGSQIANRQHAETEHLIGFFSKGLLLRADLSGDPSFREILARVRETTLGAYAHQDLPFDKLVEAWQPEAGLSERFLSPVISSLFRVVFALRNFPKTKLNLPGLEVAPVKISRESARHDLSFLLSESAAGLGGTVVYNTELFDADTIARLVEDYEVILQSVVANPDQRLSSFSLLREAAVGV